MWHSPTVMWKKKSSFILPTLSRIYNMMDTSGHLDIAALINTRQDMIHTVEAICHRGKFLFFAVNQMKNEKQPFFIMHSAAALSLEAAE